MERGYAHLDKKVKTHSGSSQKSRKPKGLRMAYIVNLEKQKTMYSKHTLVHQSCGYIDITHPTATVFEEDSPYLDSKKPDLTTVP